MSRIFSEFPLFNTSCYPICRKNDELRKDSLDALCCLAHAVGEDFTIFIPSIHKLMVKHRLRVCASPHILFSLPSISNFYLSFLCFYNVQIHQIHVNQILMQHGEFEEIEGRLKRREPLIMGTAAAQGLNKRLPVDVISDPLSDMENDNDDGIDVHRQLRSHQVLLFFFSFLETLNLVITESII